MALDIASEYRRMAAAGAFRGLTLLQHEEAIGALIKQTRAVSLLDWGAGAGDAYRAPHKVHQRWGVPMPVRYDPAFPKFARKLNGQFDGVLACDVLEHIPEADVDGVIATLFGHARLFVFASVCCRAADKTFKDGSNLHVTVMPMAWWQGKFYSRAPQGIAWRLVETP